jgi:hypothetical protein
LDRRLGGPQSRSGRGVEEKNSQPPPGIELHNSGLPARNPALYRLSYVFFNKFYFCSSVFNSSEKIKLCKGKGKIVPVLNKIPHHDDDVYIALLSTKS